MHPPSNTGRREWLLVGGIVLLALALRVTHVLFLRASPYFEAPIMDMEYHVEWARSFARGERFREGPFFRAPLYPWFLGVLTKVFGEGLLAPRLVQAVLGAASTGLTYLVGRRAFGALAGGIGALLVATSWVLVHFDALLLIPTLIVPLDLLALYLTLGLARDARPRRAALAGGVWGLSAIARPNVLLFLPFLAGWLLWRLWPRWRAGLRTVAATAAGCLVPILPITAINAARGDLVLISTQAGVNFWIGNNPDSDGSTAIVPGTPGGWEEGRAASIELAEEAEGRPLKDSEVSRHYARRASSWMLEEPGAALAHLAWKARLLWLDVELGNNLPVEFFARRYDPLLRWSPVGFTLLAGLGVLGLVLALRRGGGDTFPLWGFLGVYALSIVAFFVCSRFRVPLLPVLAVFSGHAVARALAWVRERDLRALGGGALVVLAAALPTRIVPAAVVDPETNGHLLLGQAALRDGDLDAAEEHLRRALEIRPANMYARRELAEIYRRQGLLDQALLTGEQGLDRLRRLRRERGLQQPGEPELMNTVVQVRFERDGPAGATRYLENLVEADPGCCPAYGYLQELYRRAGRNADAERVEAARERAGCR